MDDINKWVSELQSSVVRAADVITQPIVLPEGKKTKIFFRLTDRLSDNLRQSLRAYVSAYAKNSGLKVREYKAHKGYIEFLTEEAPLKQKRAFVGTSRRTRLPPGHVRSREPETTKS